VSSKPAAAHEAHLLEESLGTFSGLFDTLFETALERIDDFAGLELQVARVWDGSAWQDFRTPKIIAATATISNPDRQLEVLYQRRALRFPSAGSDIYRSFFSSPAPAPAINPQRVELERSLPAHEAPESVSPWMRVFVSLMTNDATHTVTSVALLSAFHLEMTLLWQGIINQSSRAATIERLREAQGEGTTAQWRKNALDRAVEGAREDEVAALIDLHKIALAYVTNKKGGDQIMDALDAAVLQRHRAAGSTVDRFMNRLISGGIDMKEIQAIMKLAERSNPGQPYPNIAESVRSIIATSAISHGVDVDRFNSMFFAGLPSDIAEYIQASSRVGRTHVGFVILVPTPQSRRDRYVVETHDIFHRFLERMIAPPAVERWAENAIRRVLASLVQTWAVLEEDEQLLRASDANKDRVDSYEMIRPLVTAARHDPNGLANRIGSFVLRAIGYEGRGTEEIGRPVYGELYRSLIDSEISRFVQRLRTISTPIRLKEYWDESGAAFKPPMTSLRDVDEAGLIVAGAFDMNVTHGSRTINTDQLMHVMRAIRNQKGAAAETDQDGAED
jgi:Helicase conserved C-terminal domain